jgi:hypothetical protein
MASSSQLTSHLFKVGASLVQDSCSASADPVTAFHEYAVFRDALNATGRPIVFNLCGWNPWWVQVALMLRYFRDFEILAYRDLTASPLLPTLLGMRLWGRR